MKVLLPFLLLIAVLSVFAGTSGSFAGTVIEGPDASSGWVYVQGHNHSIRRVDVSRARIRYASDMPKSERKDPVPQTLPPGTHVRVTAEQDESGEWRAKDVEILNTGGENDEKKAPQSTTSDT
jgi:hypothetical protein